MRSRLNRLSLMHCFSLCTFNMSGSTTEMTISGTGEGDAIMNSELEESLDDEAQRNTVGKAPSIVQVATRPSSDSAVLVAVQKFSE
jgi:20S proteasome alpha/beta subunit